jgi:zinc finger FYVE domain-containing protein 26
MWNIVQIISACVPPVYPPLAGKGWACIRKLPTHKVQLPPGQKVDDAHESTGSSSANEHETPQLYPLQLDVVKHLATLSVVRSVLACVFGQSCFMARSNRSNSAHNDTDRLLYDFALEQSERFVSLALLSNFIPFLLSPLIEMHPLIQ